MGSQLSPEWWEKWDARSKYFNELGELTGYEAESRPWDNRIEDLIQELRRRDPDVQSFCEEMAALSAMLKAMMAFKPGERPTASELLEFEWMRKWALPELEKIPKSAQCQ